MLRLPDLPPDPTAVEIRKVYDDGGGSLMTCKAILQSKVRSQRREIVLGYIKECRNFEELKAGLIAWIEKC